jgi:DNA-binding NarL/FixJ family response regulator
MNQVQFFVMPEGGDVPARWREAFADGHVVSAAALPQSLQGQAASTCLLWLDSGDALWPVHLRRVQQILPGARVVLMSGMPQADEGLSALNDGVRGYTHSHAVPALLQEVALVVGHGGLWVGPDLLQRLVGATHAALLRRPPTPLAQGVAAAAASTRGVWSALSAREAEVARTVSEGRSNREVASLLFISERTVKAHLGAVFEKLGVRDRLQLVLRLSEAADEAPQPRTESPI